MKAADLTIGECYAYAPWQSADLTDPRCVPATLLDGPRDVEGKGKRWPVDIGGETVWVAARHLHGPWGTHRKERQRIIDRAELARRRVERMHAEIGAWVAAMNERLLALGFPERAGTPRGHLGLVLDSPHAERLLALAEAGLRAMTKENPMTGWDGWTEEPGPRDMTEEELTELLETAGDAQQSPEDARALYDARAAAADAGDVPEWAGGKVDDE